MSDERIVLCNCRLVTDEQSLKAEQLHPFVDIFIERGMITHIERTGTRAYTGYVVHQLAGLYASSGWIDMHVHAFAKHQPYGDEIDQIGIAQGVTTVVDAGSCGADQIAELYDIGQTAQTRLLAFLNISRIGLQRVDELTNMAWMDEQLVAEACEQYGSFIVGLKARISKTVVGDSGIKPLEIARNLAVACNKRLMVHIGSGPPAITEVLPLLAEGDIITHFLHGKVNNLFAASGEPIAELLAAWQRGVMLDVGHGSASFSFATAEVAKQHGIHPNTISSDIYRVNRLEGPVFSLAHVMSKFLYLGYQLEEVIAAVTTRAAAWLHRPELGRMQVGEAANITLFAIEQGEVDFVDSGGEKRQANQLIVPKGVMINDKFFTC
ncbi:amidohydrolase/deacetylase family metallohydrolase [Paenibacillus yanchengensis]|uniref:Amidohydrolase/deacetylase family metallohydrolase n=1 Tax=Paenibacillus yanchengensis TaxID=2035833 RepID=A0ABW4YJ85_9BACL